MTAPAIDPDAVAEALDAVHARIRSVAGTRSSEVSVLAVTKGFGPDAIDAAVAAGIDAIGENYAQELLSKVDALVRHGSSLHVHFIGQLQSNKVRSLVDRVHRFETVDRSSLVRELARRRPGARVLVQVDTSGEAGKGGCAEADVAALVEQALDAGLAVEGLMTVGPTEGGAAAARPGFARVRRAVDELGLTVCSMGMSADLEVAVAEGSTQVRVGAALFGPRPSR